MTWWKFIYDAKTPTWSAYGRVAFVQGDTEDQARLAALDFARRDYPGSEILPAALGQSTPEAATAYFERRERMEAWKRNVANGVPNEKRSL